MKRIILLVLSIFVFQSIINSQNCLPNGISFFTQSDIDNFQTNHPGCTQIEGDVFVGGGGGDINNLNGLQSIETIDGNLFISFNPLLSDISGLGNLTKIGENLNIEANDILTSIPLTSLTEIGRDFITSFNQSLENFTGLENLKTITGSFMPDGNPSLSSYNGLNNLEYVGGDFFISSTELVANLEGLNSLKEINGGLDISFHQNLETLDGLNALEKIGTFLNIADNPMLTNLDGLQNLTTIGGKFFITNNEYLESISGLGNLILDQNSEGTVSGNSSLGDCSALGPCNYITSNPDQFPTNIEFSNNFFGCFDITEVYVGCVPGLCLPTDVEFTSQWEIDEFLIENPDCRFSYSSITLTGDDITNVDGFINLDSIAGDLSMSSLSNLDDLNGLSNLRVVDGDTKFFSLGVSSFEGLENLERTQSLELTFNYNNVDFEGFSGLKRIEQDLRITQNSMLESNAGFDSLEFIGGQLIFMENQPLSDMDGFPRLKELGSRLRLNENITSISGFNALETYNGDLSFFDFDLSNISGFQNLRKIDGSLLLSLSFDFSVTGFNNLDTITNNFKFEAFVGETVDLSGFNNLKYVGRNFEIEGYSPFPINMNSTISSFNQLHTIGYEFNMKVNDGIFDLSTFQNLKKIKRINFETNTNLRSIDALDNLDFVNLEYLRLVDNPDLEICSNNAICNYIAIGGNNEISGNAPGCESQSAIEVNCITSTGKIRYATFYDLNQDGTKQSGEPFFANAPIDLQPLNITLFGNPDSLSRVILPATNYTLSSNIPQDWRATTPINVVADLSSGAACDTILFGIFPEVQRSEINTFVASPPTRCNESIQFEITANNFGTNIQDGWLWLEIDTNIQNVFFVDTPDNTDTPNLYGWLFEDLFPGNSISKMISLQIPGPLDFPIGENLVFNSFTTLVENGMTQTTGQFEYLAELRCAYDPNDKLVNPSRNGNFTQFDETLTYTIRFQNTGNDFARDVAIRDVIDSNLDLSTFQILGSSHFESLSTSIENRLVTFEFTDIFLPDSTSNFEGSNGFVMFTIQPIAGNLSEFSNIENQASIFFDFNPPIETNTALNVMVSSIVDADNDGFFEFQDCDDFNSNINPDAIETPNNTIDENCDGIALIIDDDMDGFNSDDDCDDANANINPDAIEIPNNNIDEDCDGIALIIDDDMDGFNSDDDCDDANADINPDAMEIPNNNIDENCDGITLIIDDDMDGFNSDEDCDDTNPNINPDGIEIPNNGIDEDCDGFDTLSGVEDVFSAKFKVYPNPTSGKVFIESDYLSKALISISDPTGRILLVEKLNENFIQLPKGAAGLLFLKIETEQGIAVKRILKN